MNRKLLLMTSLSAAVTLWSNAQPVLTQNANPTRPPKSSPTATDKPRAEEQTLTQSVRDLNENVKALSGDLKHFKTDMVEVTTLFRTMLIEQRQGELEKQLAEVQDQLWGFDEEEHASRDRLRNLDRERFSTGSAFVTQEQARRQIREQLERRLQYISTRKPILIEREAQLREQLNDLHSKWDKLKQELEDIERNREARKEQEKSEPQ